MSKKKSPDGSGWYHTGTDSFDYPEIERFGKFGPPKLSFGFGPFRTFQAAQKDLVNMISSDMDNLRILYNGVIALRRVKK